MTTFEQHVLMTLDCAERDSKLTDWERGFIDDIGHQLDQSRPLSEKQAEQLDKIWERVT
jgi:hypothetical protein